MLVNMYFDGIDVKTSAKGNEFAVLYLRSINADGTPDFRQEKLNTFNQDVISCCKKLKPTDVITVDITVRDGIIETVNI